MFSFIFVVSEELFWHWIIDHVLLVVVVCPTIADTESNPVGGETSGADVSNAGDRIRLSFDTRDRILLAFDG